MTTGSRTTSTVHASTPAASPSPAAPKRGVRLIDIAAKAGVSSVTVSKVLFPNGINNTRCSPETAERVRRVADELGYMPNLSAKQLAGQKSRLIGVITNPYIPEVSQQLLGELNKRAAEKKYRLIVAHEDINSQKNTDLIAEYLQDFIGRGVEGVISLASVQKGMPEKLKKLYKAVDNVVFVGLPVIPWANWVGIDIAAGIRNAVKHLAAGGRRNIALFIPEEKIVFFNARVEGFEEQIIASGLNPKQCPTWYIKLTPDQTPRQINHSSLEALLRDYPQTDAIIAANDIIALYVLQYLHDHQIRIPEQIAVVGFDNLEMSWAASPPLTSLDQRTPIVAEKIMQLLLPEECESEKTSAKTKPQTILIEPELIIRRSTKPILPEDPQTRSAEHLATIAPWAFRNKGKP